MPEDADHTHSAAPEDADLASSYPTLEEMADLLPQYEIHRVIGIGGMGAIYLGRQTALDRWVAIKLLPISAAQNAEDAQRFIKEARSMAKLVHPHIVAVFDFGQTVEGHLYLVMEYVEGCDLHQRTRGGEITPQRMRQVIFQLCDALQFAHDRGVIHRDIKPANILITDQWQVKIADFGLAREMAAIPNADEPEYGTPDYTAPERLIVGAVVDHRADIYALGVVMHEMLTGKTPHSSGEIDKNLPPEFAEVIAKCLAADPDERYQKAKEIKMALADAMTDRKKEPATTTTPATARHPLPSSDSSTYRPPSALEKLARTLGPVGLGIASVALVAGLGWMLVRNAQNPTETTASGGAAHNTNAGAGNLTVFAPPSPETAPATPELATPQKPAEMAPAALPTPEPAPPEKKVAAAKEMEEPITSLPTVPLDHPYQVEDGPPGEVARLKGHTASTYAIKLFDDQRRLVSASYDGTVRIWDLLNQTELLRLDPGIAAISRMALSPDGKRLVVVSTASAQAAVIDVTTAKVIAKTTYPDSKASAVTFAPDGHTILAATTAELPAPNLYRWDPDKGSRLEPITKVEASIYELRVLPGDPPGRVYISGSVPMNNDSKFRRGICFTLDVNTNDVTPPLTGPWAAGGRATLSTDGSLMTILGGASIYVLKQPALELVKAIPFPPNAQRPAAVSLLTDGRLLASAWYDNTLRLLEVETGEEVYRGPLGKRPSDIAVSRDGRWAVISTSRTQSAEAAEGDFDLLIHRLPPLDSLVSDKALTAQAAQQISDLPANDPELAKLRDSLPPTLKIPSLEDKAAQLRTLNTQYVSALRRKAQTQSPTEQRILLDEADAITRGTPLPSRGVDVGLISVLRDLRNIYRNQLTGLETQQKQAVETVTKDVIAYFTPTLAQREQTGDRIGAARVKALIQSLVPGAAIGEFKSATDAANKPVTAVSSDMAAASMAGTLVKRPSRLCNVLSIPRTAKNGYMPVGVGVSQVPADLGSVVAIAGGGDYAYALLADGKVKGWGSWSGNAVSSPSDVDIVRLDGSDSAMLALRADGKVVAWGPGAEFFTFSPPKDRAVADICAGGDGGGFAICTDGSLYPTFGSTRSIAESTPPANLGPVAKLFYVPHAGYCALLRDGSCVYWGRAVTPITPPPTGMHDLTSVSFSEKYAVALQRDGVMGGWGELAQGQRFRVARYNSTIGVLHDPSGRLFPVHRSDHSWELLPNPATPEYLSEDHVSALEGKLRGCVDALFTQYSVLCLRPQ